MRRLATVLVVLAACGGGDPADIDGGASPRADAGPTIDGGTDANVPPPDGGGVVPDAGDYDAGTADASLPPLRDDALLPDWRWDEKAARAIDGATLEAAFAADGWTPPAGVEIYAARIVDGVEGPAYVLYEAGGGAFSLEYWPASTVKVLSALGAITEVRARGFTGAATVTFDTGFSDELRAIVDRAIRVSSNIDYDRTVRIAGFDWLNETFLSSEHGFPTAVIQRSYSGIGVRSTPGLTLTEGAATEYVPARTGTGDYGCGDDGNCASLFELTEAVRRIVLDAELAEPERFDLDAADVAALTDALCHATPSFFADGAAAALGGSPRICHKPGWVPYNDCLDHGVVEGAGERFLLAAAVPETAGSSDCLALSDVAEHVLGALRGRTSGMPLQRDAGVPITVQLDDGGTTAELRRRYRITIEAPDADRVALFTDRWPIGDASGPGPRFEVEYDYTGGGERLLVVRAFRGATEIGYRAMRVAITSPGG